MVRVPLVKVRVAPKPPLPVSTIRPELVELFATVRLALPEFALPSIEMVAPEPTPSCATDTAVVM